jgi:hypothetical protein
MGIPAKSADRDDGFFKELSRELTTEGSDIKGQKTC